ncbi:MAG: prolyl aminopeptidase, partial [Pseudomonadota bacterium]
MSRVQLYPAIRPNQTGMLKVGPIHQIYWEESGNPRGAPVVFLHGGPGAGASPVHRRFFDPQHYRIIILDQRGSGRSQPLGELSDNTTQALISDLEALRSHLDIARWHLFGGSWGSTLALAYAQEHPERCLSLTLRGIFLMRRAEIDWFLYGMRRIFPEAWRRFASHIGPEDQGDLLGAYYKLLTDPDPSVHQPAARVWSQYESACSTLYPNHERANTGGNEAHAIGLS